MEAIEIARRLSELNKIEEAQKAYSIVLQQSSNDIEKYEAALYFLYTNFQTKFSFLVLLDLFNKGNFQNEIFQNFIDFALVPKIEKMQNTYQKNIELLQTYPYIFKKNFCDFDDLNKRFFKLDDLEYIDYSLNKNCFGKPLSVSLKQIKHHFFKDLSKPIFAEDIYSQYELEYLFDNVRESEFIAKENHIYLYYSSFAEFQSYLQIIDFSKILKNNKFVFLFEDEKDLYPINFKEIFDIDYSEYPVKPIDINEITRLIWSVQQSYHNGGDFFNEILDNHPNLIANTSIMMDSYNDVFNLFSDSDKNNLGVTSKDVFICSILTNDNKMPTDIDATSRILPVIYFQPHFSFIQYDLKKNNKSMIGTSKEIDAILTLDSINQFKYIKTIVPLRRITTSHAAALRFNINLKEPDKEILPFDLLVNKLTNKSLYINPNDKIFADSRVVRFEDGKLNPKATFTALAEFLDIPYTPSMEYCSFNGEIDPKTYVANVRGFDSATVFRTYDEFCDDEERIILEYFSQKEMAKYGYENHYLCSPSLSKEELHHLADNRYKLKEHTFRKKYEFELTQGATEQEARKKAEDYVNLVYPQQQAILHNTIDFLYPNLPLVNEQGHQLKLMEPLKLDESLLEQPLYK